jgi:hypothetical protein
MKFSFMNGIQKRSPICELGLSLMLILSILGVYAKMGEGFILFLITILLGISYRMSLKADREAK